MIMSTKKETKEIESITVSAVLYTDGSANPNPGYGGWGIHGYTYDSSKPIELKAQKKNLITQYGYKDLKFVQRDDLSVYKKIDEFNGFGTAVPRITDNVAMELTALEKGMDFALKENFDKVTILTDSQVSINALTNWYNTWVNNGWVNSKGEPVKIKADIQRIYPKYEQLAAKADDFKLLFVKGHSGDYGNDLVDALANKGSTMKQYGKTHEELIYKSGIEKVKVDYHDLFSRNRWYFIGGQGGGQLNNIIDDYHWYYLGALGHGKSDEDFGMNQPDGFMSIVILKEPEPVIEKVQKAYNEICKHDYSFVVAGRLDNLLTPEIYQDIMSDKVELICEDKMEKTLLLPNRKILAKEYNPAHLSFSQMVKYDYPMKLLRNYLGTTETVKLTKTDITNELIEKQPGKKEGEMKYAVNSHVLKNNCLRTHVDYYNKAEKQMVKLPITLTLKTDLPDKPHLQKLIRNHGDKIKFTIVTHHLSDLAVGYALIADLGDDAKAIWVSSTMTSVILRK